jgi:hypothetical protein
MKSDDLKYVLLRIEEKLDYLLDSLTDWKKK